MNASGLAIIIAKANAMLLSSQSIRKVSAIFGGVLCRQRRAFRVACWIGRAKFGEFSNGIWLLLCTQAGNDVGFSCGI